MGRRLADVMENVPFSGTRKFFDIVSKMEGVIPLSVGEPDFITPEPIREAGIKALRQGKTRYTTNAGLPELRREVSAYMERTQGLSYGPTQVLMTAGSSEGVFSSLRAVIDPGDEVIVVEPCYVSYKPSIYMSGGVPVTVEAAAEDQFRLRPDRLLEKISPRTKALILNYPNNPTGAVMEREDLERIAEVLAERDIIVISDEVYGELTYGGLKHVSIAELEGMYDKTVVLNAFSKTFSMTGWRLGYACGPEDIIQSMLRIHTYLTMSAATMSQYAGIEAMRNCGESVGIMRQEYDKRRKLMLKGFRDMGLDCFEPLGAFYLFPSIEKTGLNSDEFVLRLLNEKKVELIPGTAFGACGDKFVRCSYAYSVESINAGLTRIAEFLEGLK